jgi:hypothetical protein
MIFTPLNEERKFLCCHTLFKCASFSALMSYMLSLTQCAFLDCRTFSDLLSRLRSDAPIAYLQSQNSNLTDNSAGDLSPLLEDLFVGDEHDHRTSSLTWADEALGKTPDATNLWIGTSKSKTSMHRDHYENLFTVIRGTKIFTIYPPSEAYFLCDGELRRRREKNEAEY